MRRPGKTEPGGSTAAAVDVLEPKPTPRPAGPGPMTPAPMLAMPKRRKRVGLISAGIVLIAVFAGGAFWLANTATVRVAVVGVAQDVAQGQLITQSDLREVKIVNDPGLLIVPWSQETTLVGQRAAVDLQAGALFTPKSMTTQDVPGPGLALVGVSLKPSQMPVTSLQSGDQIDLILTPATTQATSGTTAAAVVPQIAGKVFTVGAAGSGGARTVDVLVGLSDASRIAVASTSGDIAIVLVPRG